MWERFYASDEDKALEVIDELFKTINQLQYQDKTLKKQKQQIDDLEKVLEQLKPKPKKKDKKENKDNTENTPKLVSTHDPDKEDDHWLEKQIELIRQPIYLVLEYRDYTLKFTMTEGILRVN